MKMELNRYSTVCEIKVFKINGIRADYKDFGDKYDISPDVKNASCGNMIFKPRTPSQQVLEKYGITNDEYICICEQLRDILSFGLCRLCS